MSSMFARVDFAEDDRRKMADVIARFSEKHLRQPTCCSRLPAPSKHELVISCSSRGFTKGSNADARCLPISNGSRGATRFASRRRKPGRPSADGTRRADTPCAASSCEAEGQAG
jgi:hypothetical protein